MTQDKPIFLSIGYSACHWCHVMERESFEDEATAALMNELFVNIKVDREERPDLDAIYMEAVQAMTGQGGWPMSVFLTPDGQPFYGGTYYPPEPRYGMPSFQQVLQSVADAYRERREQVDQQAQNLTDMLSRTAVLESQSQRSRHRIRWTRRSSSLAQRFDDEHGGFGSQPKFPQPMNLDFLHTQYLRTGELDTLYMAERTLEQMALGGIYDQLGGGFHRYSVDAVWLVPHFEKMLYDNAQLLRTYLHAWQITPRPLYRRIVEETIDYVLREMTRSRRRLLQHAGRGQRGRGGQVLRVDAGGDRGVTGRADRRACLRPTTASRTAATSRATTSSMSAARWNRWRSALGWSRTRDGADAGRCAADSSLRAGSSASHRRAMTRSSPSGTG